MITLLEREIYVSRWQELTRYPCTMPLPCELAEYCAVCAECGTGGCARSALRSVRTVIFGAEKGSSFVTDWPLPYGSIDDNGPTSVSLLC